MTDPNILRLWRIQMKATQYLLEHILHWNNFSSLWMARCCTSSPLVLQAYPHISHTNRFNFSCTALMCPKTADFVVNLKRKRFQKLQPKHFQSHKSEYYLFLQMPHGYLYLSGSGKCTLSCDLRLSFELHVFGQFIQWNIRLSFGKCLRMCFSRADLVLVIREHLSQLKL